ncbi:hypothetical protein [Pedobacter metabolipauper]|uniref:Uncharacterized protein n=1 Tax=Pedobacter metabolipauper TaxID=425513 RepID=A0A4R6T1D7_9SPHI|nr:hypothetical protein [Pedobacter metabolipauper]TDQ12215.1 hypothetical protein ATK78_1349 [Pedobacter metabolipauper]
MEDLKEYAALVERMRIAQNEYFRTRAQVAMSVSIKLEKLVDEATESILGPDRIINQQKLF